MNTDPRMPPLDHVVLRDVLHRQSQERPDKVFAVFENGVQWTYLETWNIACSTANALRKLGVKQGDKVVSWLPNGPDSLRMWFGLNCLGAVFVPINLAYRGRLLEHVIRNANPRLVVVHSELASRLDDIDQGSLTDAVVIDGHVEPAGLRIHAAAALDSADSTPPVLDRPIAPWDTQSIIYTSGTTGPSKGVLSSYYHLRCMGMAMQDMGETDRYFINLPLFHVGGTMPVTAMVIRGGSIVVTASFDTESFWPLVRTHGITSSIVLGAMASFLLKRPAAADDRDHTLRCVVIVPYNETAVAFRERFGCDLFTFFNMSEVSIPILTEANPESMGSCGFPREGVAVRVVDDNDCEVPQGDIGELVVRTDSPWAMNHGYNANAEATASAWRNGWFHTGDGFKVDADGRFTFVDRIKDAIRRRGENISSAEVEAEVVAHPQIKDAAAVAVPSEHGEDEVLVAVVLVSDAIFDPAELIGFLLTRMPHFMIPRYVRVMPDLPRTPTHKVQKHLLRETGLSAADVWDREAAGVVVRTERIGPKGNREGTRRQG